MESLEKLNRGLLNRRISTSHIPKFRRTRGMEEDGAAAPTKTKSRTLQKFRSGTSSLARKFVSLEHKYDEIKRIMQRKKRDGMCPKESDSKEDDLKKNTDSSAEEVKKESLPQKELKPADTADGTGRNQMELYYFAPSPPCRAVMLFMHALSLDPIMKEVDISKGDNLKPEYVKLNPQRTIPVIVDDGFVLSESRAILGYLAERYGGVNATYYPNDPKTRGVINQRLLFDIGTLYQRFLDLYMEMFFSERAIELNAEKVRKLHEALEFLEAFIGDSKWMAGDEITIADYSLVVTVSTIEACGFDLTQYKRLSIWLDRCKREMINYDEVNQKGADNFGQLVKNKLRLADS